jgi:hypothetical protein
MVGFQPSSVARIQSATANVQDAVEQNRIASSEISDVWAQGIAQKDADKVQQAQQMLRDWNRRNPESPIRPNLSAIARKARLMQEDKATRVEKAAPKALRPQVREELAAARGLR